MASFFDRVKVAAGAAPGTGAVALGAAVAGFRTFDGAGVPDQAAVSYVIEDGANYEFGRGIYTKSGASLARTSILGSSNNGAAINAGAAAVVYLTLLAEDVALLVAAAAASGGRLPMTSLSRVADFAIGANTWAAIPWDTSDLDEVGGFSAASDATRITVPAGMKHVRITAYVAWENGQPNIAYFRIDKNGAPVQGNLSAANNESAHGLVSRWMPVVAGDYFQCLANSGGTGANVQGSSFVGPSFMQAEWATN